MLLVETPHKTGYDPLFANVLEPLTEKVIKPLVRRQLRLSLQTDDTSFENQNGLELVGDIQTALVAALQADTDGKGNALLNIEAYATTVTSNACSQYLRSRFPVTTALQNALRYFLSHTEGYAIWQDQQRRWLCGYSQWQDDPHSRPVAIPADSGNAPLIGNSRQKYVAILRSIFNETNGPVLLDELVPQTMGILRMTERVHIGHDDDSGDGPPTTSIPSHDQSVQSHLETISRLKLLWDGISAMSLSHRMALLLNLKDDGGGLIAILPLSGIAGVQEIADVLGFSIEELEEIWETLPWKDQQIAEHLGITRQQVINLRQSARARLLRLTGKKP